MKLSILTINGWRTRPYRFMMLVADPLPPLCSVHYQLQLSITITNYQLPVTNSVNYKNPAPTVDIIIELVDRPHRPIVLIERQHPPYGWAIPGGFVDYGESVETAAKREALEETSLNVELIEQFYVYSEPDRDSRQHTISIVFLAAATGEPQAADDAKNLQVFGTWEIPKQLCFDHDRILQDYVRYRNYGLRPRL